MQCSMLNSPVWEFPLIHKHLLEDNAILRDPNFQQAKKCNE
jgi:hypothetical protein